MADPTEIINWRRLGPCITTSGQPTTAQLAAIAALGVRHVINLALHTHEHALPDERADVTRLGMAYTHIPVDFAAPTESDFAAFCTALEATQPDPVHVHCIMNWRVSAFFYRYRRDVLGHDERSARADMDPIWQPHGVWEQFCAPRPTHAPDAPCDPTPPSTTLLRCRSPTTSAPKAPASPPAAPPAATASVPAP